MTAGEEHPPTQTSMVTRISRKPPSQECHLDIYGYRYPSLLMQLVIGILYGALMNFLFGFGGNGTHHTSKLGQKQDRKHFKIQLKIRFIFLFGFGGNGTHHTSKRGQKQGRKHFKIQLWCVPFPPNPNKKYSPQTKQKFHSPQTILNMIAIGREKHWLLIGREFALLYV